MLLLEKLELENFGVLQGKHTFDYKEGINIIMAQNGSGKSTSIQAIEMLLIDNYEGSYENYINNNCEYFKTHLYFSYNNNKYSIKLDCKKNKSANLTTRVFYDDKGNELASGDEAKQKLAELFDPVTVKYALVSKQKRLDNIVTCSDSERRDLMKKVKDLSYVKEVKDYLEPKLEFVKNEIVEVDKKIFALENKKYTPKDLVEYPFTEKEYLDKQTEIKKLERSKILYEQNVKENIAKKTELEEIKIALQNLQTSLEKKQKELSDIEEKILYAKEKEYNETSISIQKQIDEALSTYDKKVEEITNNLQQLENIYTTEYTIIEKKLVSLQKDYEDKYRLTIEALKKDITFKKEELKEEEKKVEAIKIVKLLKYDDTTLQSLMNRKVELTTEVNSTKKDLQVLESGVCPVCDNKDCSHKISEYTQKIKNLSKDLENNENLLNMEIINKKAHEEKVEQNEKNRVLLQELKAKVDKINNEINKLESSLSSMEQEKTIKMQNEEKELNTKLTTLKETKNLKEKNLKDQQETLLKTKNSEVELLNKSLEQLQKSIDDKITQYEKTKESINSDVITINRDLEIQESKKIIITKYLEENVIEVFDNNVLDTFTNEVDIYSSIVIQNDTIKLINQELVEQEKKDKIILNNEMIMKKKLLEDKYYIEQAKTILLNDFPNYVIDATIQETEDSMNNFIERVYTKSLNVSLRSTKTSIKLEYGTGARQLPASRLSGAESQIVQLSFINNFNAKIGLGCLILDEPDAALDNNNKQELFETILSMQEVYPQLCIVTHSKQMKDYLVQQSLPNIINL